MSDITLRFWHGGIFKVGGNGELLYEGGQGRTFAVDVDVLSVVDLVRLAKNCGDYAEICGLLYLLPGMSLSSGLRKLCSDVEMIEMAAVAKKNRAVDVYVYHKSEFPTLTPSTPPETKTHFEPLNSQAESLPQHSSTPVKGRKKNKPKRGPPTKFLGTPIPSKKTETKQKPKPHNATKGASRVCTRSKLDPTKNTQQESVSLNTQPQTTTKPNPRKVPNVGSSQKTQSKSKIKSASPSPNIKVDTHDTHTDEWERVYGCDDYDWLDDRPDEPLTIEELVGRGFYSDSEEGTDPLYDPYTDKGKGRADSVDEGYEDEGYESEGYESEYVQDGISSNDEDVHVEPKFESFLAEDEILCDSEVSDDELETARKRVRQCYKNLADQAFQLQKEAEQTGRAGVVSSVPPEVDTDGLVSEYEDTDDEIHTPPESGDEEVSLKERRRRRDLIVRADSDFETFTWKLGQRFPTKAAFKDAVARYGILQGRNVYISVSDHKRGQRVGVKCVSGCPFRLYASWDSGRAAMIVRTLNNEHTCFRNMVRNRQLKSCWVARQFLEIFKARPHWPAKEIKDCIKKSFKVLVTRGFAYRVKYVAHKLLHGSMAEHYMKLGGYVDALKSSSPGSVFEIVRDFGKGIPIFQRLYTCFDGVSKGWKEGCRSVLSVDACFIKTFLGGQLVSAVGHDGNDQMYPVAWAVVEGENNESWHWFFTHLKDSLALGDGEGVTVISDQNQGIINAVASVLPAAEHRHCARHIFAHWHKSYKGDQMKQLFWKIVKAYNMADYNDALQEMADINDDAVATFKSYNPKLFCRAFMSCSVKCDSVTSNMAEAFNAYVINARTKHLIYMMEEIRASLMQRLVVKRDQMEASSAIICPRIQQKLDKEKAKASDCEVVPSTATLFNVSYYMDNLVVDLEAMTCTCRKWDLTAIPCRHAIACMYFQHKGPEEFVGECYKRDAYLKCYAGSIPPCVGERHWPKPDFSVHPPPIKIGPGRPKKLRIKDAQENPKKPGSLSRTGMEMTCQLCHSKGHNKRGCPRKGTATHPSEPPVKRPCGRPRKDGRPPQPRSTPTAAVSTPTAPVSVGSQPLSTPTAPVSVGSQPLSSSDAPPTHHSAPALPSQVGRGGRMIRGGRGSRGMRGGRGGRGRGRNQIPVGVGVLFAEDGSPFTNLPRSSSASKPITRSSTQSSQVQ